MKTYVVGFLFSPDFRQVVLLRKAKPAWQRGRLNGVGGSVEQGEKPREAMQREFMEEAGWDLNGWQPFLRLDYLDSDVRLFFYKLQVDPAMFPMLERPTDEPVDWYSTEHVVTLLSDEALIPNLRWIIPLAISGDKVRAEI